MYTLPVSVKCGQPRTTNWLVFHAKWVGIIIVLSIHPSVYLPLRNANEIVAKLIRRVDLVLAESNNSATI